MTGARVHRTIVWMRRALRVQDNLALWLAWQNAAEVIPVFFLRDDPQYRETTPRRQFIRSALVDLDAALQKLGTRLHICIGRPDAHLPALARAYGAAAVYAVRVYDPRLRECDERLARTLRAAGVQWHDVPDTVIAEQLGLSTAAGTPFRLFTPFKRAWLKRYREQPIRSLPPLRRLRGCTIMPPAVSVKRIAALNGMLVGGGATQARKQLDAFVRHGLAGYDTQRNILALPGTSRLSAHLAHGTLSVRTVMDAICPHLELNLSAGSDAFLTELIWREFYYHILASFPHVVDRPFKDAYGALAWRNDEAAFISWVEGRTGYPIVDAGMRQLLQEGWMHNRARMITASFLTKDLHIDWRRGERYFSEKLVDADLASNNGGWQWSAGTGTDSPPFFRIFNPVVQGKRFDRDGTYIRRYVPELHRVPASHIHEPWRMTRAEQQESGCMVGKDYPLPIVDHNRERVIALELHRTAGANIIGAGLPDPADA